MRSCFFVVTAASLAIGCGDAFTQASSDSADGGMEGGADDGASPHDGGGASDSSADASADATGDGGGGASDAGDDDGAAACSGACQSGFECVLGFCVDRAATHFSATANPSGNWLYASETSLGSSAFTPYPLHAVTMGSLDVWDALTGSLAPSVFFNASATSGSYSGFTLAAKSLGFAPAPPLPGSTSPPTTPVSVLRWTCPAAGQYAIDATFTGLAPSNMTTVSVGVFINGAVGTGIQGGALNVEGGTNTFVFSQATMAMNAGDRVDFYVNAVMSSVWISGYTGIEAHFTGR
jgi:hypothetical protein